MQKIDLDSLSIEELAKLCDLATEKLADRIAARQRELSAEMERLAALSRKTKAAAPRKDVKEVRDVKEAPKPPAPAKAA
jgi:hypothetical protein